MYVQSLHSLSPSLIPLCPHPLPADMLKAVTLNDPSPKSPPAIPPRTYASTKRASKPVRKFKLEDFKFVKVLGKGSFGKVKFV